MISKEKLNSLIEEIFDTLSYHIRVRGFCLDFHHTFFVPKSNFCNMIISISIVFTLIFITYLIGWLQKTSSTYLYLKLCQIWVRGVIITDFVWIFIILAISISAWWFIFCFILLNWMNCLCRFLSSRSAVKNFHRGVQISFLKLLVIIFNFWFMPTNSFFWSYFVDGRTYT